MAIGFGRESHLQRISLSRFVSKNGVFLRFIAFGSEYGICNVMRNVF